VKKILDPYKAWQIRDVSKGAANVYLWVSKGAANVYLCLGTKQIEFNIPRSI
jgi:hypothetical protein